MAKPVKAGDAKLEGLKNTTFNACQLPYQKRSDNVTSMTGTLNQPRSVIMKSVSAKWLAAHLLVAAASFFSLSPSAWAGDGQTVRSEPAATELAAAAVPGGKEQMSKADAAYARGDYVEAFRLYRNVAVLGISEAHYRLGLMYLDGVGTRKNQRQAEYWLKLAASQNHPGAAATLGSLKSTEAQG